MTEIIEDGIRYEIQDGKVVEASAEKTAAAITMPYPGGSGIHNGTSAAFQQAGIHATVTAPGLPQPITLPFSAPNMFIMVKMFQAQGHLKQGEPITVESDNPELAAQIIEQQSGVAASVDVKPQARVSYGKKLGTVVGVLESVYGSTAVVKFDDGSLDELLVEDLSEASEQRTASVEPTSLEDEYKAYRAMPQDTADEINEKAHKARELNLRAKAAVTNSRLPLDEQITYDKIVVATGVDILDLKEAEQYAKAANEEYLTSLPKYRLPEELGLAHGNDRGGDASWLFDAANEFVPTIHEDEELARRANRAVSQFSREQLEDESLMDLALVYAKEELADSEKNENFERFFVEARVQRLADEEGFQKSAAVEELKDLDGNSFKLEDVPAESLYGA